MADLLNITTRPHNEVAVEDYEYHNYQSQIPGPVNANDELRIAIQDLDAYTAPCNSYLYLEGKLKNSTGTAATKLRFINNAIAYLFREIRYELNGIVIDSVRNVGIVTTIKNYLSFNRSESIALENAGWFPLRGEKDKILVDANGLFSVCIPLKLWLGFFEDFNKIIVNAKQELVLIRSSSDIDAVIGDDETETPFVDIQKLLWKVPHVVVNMHEQLRLNRLAHKNVDIPINFRSWELIEYPSLQETSRHTWPIKTTTKVETARHVAIVFSEDRKDKLTKDMSQFDHCELRNLTVFLNSKRYPYHDLYLDWDNNKYSTLYEMFSNFQESYYHNRANMPIFNPQEFKTKAPIVHINCSRQQEAIQSGSVVLRVEFETNKPINKNTTAYCLIFHEKHFSYNPLSKIVKQY